MVKGLDEDGDNDDYDDDGDDDDIERKVNAFIFQAVFGKRHRSERVSTYAVEKKKPEKIQA